MKHTSQYLIAATGYLLFLALVVWVIAHRGKNTMAKTAGPFTMPESHAAWVGRIAEAWAQLEFHIDRGIWELCSAPQQLAACITSQFLSVHPRMNALTALAELRGASEKTVKEIKTFVGDRINPLVEQRNRAVHDPRLRDKESGEIHRLEITARPHLQFGFKAEPVSKLEEVHRKISETVIDFIKLRDRVISEIRALPPESQPTLLSIIDVP